MIELNNVDKELALIDKDVDYLAQCYIQENTSFELPMSDEDTLINISYNELKRRVREKILMYRPLILIDENILMGYLDYYFQFVQSN